MSELVKGQFARTRKAISEVLEGISPEVLDAIPAGFRNNIHWQVGHILVITEKFISNDQLNIPENYNEIFGNGTKPADWSGDIPSVETLVEQLNEQLVRIKEIPSEAFDQKLPEKFLGNETVGELIAMGAFHEAMHLGQIQSLKKIGEAK
jgi:hypothetical protein